MIKITLGHDSEALSDDKGERAPVLLRVRQSVLEGKPRLSFPPLFSN